MDTIKINSSTDMFGISTAFVDKYIKDANASYIKVYLYIARHSHSGTEMSLKKISDDTGLLKSDVVSALKFWQECGVLSYNETSINLHTITADIKEKSVQKPLDEPKENAPLLSPNTSVASSYRAASVIKTVSSDEKLAHLFAIISQLINKSLSDYLKLPEQVIIVLFEYCVSISQTNMRYIEKIAYSWADEGINTPEKALSYVKKKSKEQSTFSKYKKKFKIRGRDLTTTEEKYLLTWLNEYKADEDLIMLAFDKAVMNTGNISFPYMDSVIRGELGGEKTKKDKPLSSNIKKSTFRNYPQDNTIGEIEKQMIEKMMSRYGGGDDAINK